MGPSLNLSFSKILVAAIVLAVVVSTLTILAFVIGQQRGVELASAGGYLSLDQNVSGKQTQSPAAMPALPKAVTATPKSKMVEKWSFSNEQATRFAQDQSISSQTNAPMVVKNIEFSPEKIRLSGELNYAGTMGDFEILGFPLIESRELHFRISRMLLDGQDLPHLAFSAVESQVDLFFSQLLSGYDVMDVELGEGFISADVLPW